METWLDLHMHTKYSMDGQFEPADLMRQCADTGVTTVAVTDHDSARAIPEARQEAARLGLNLVPGIEISCQHKGKNFHLLGYGIHAGDPVFAAIEKDVYGQRRAISEKVLDAVEALGIVLDRPAIWKLCSGDAIASVHIARVALADPRNADCPVLAPYRPGGARSDAPYVNFGWDICGQGGPAFVPMTFMDFAKAVAIIHDHGGVAVLAHPGANMKQNRPLTEELIATGLDGIEAYCSYHDEETTAFYRCIADDYGLMATLGSDYHGRAKPHIRLGTYGHPEPQILWDRLCQKIKQQHGEVYVS